MMDSLSLRHRPKKFAPCAALVLVGALAAVTVFAGARFVVLDVAHPPGLDFVHRNSATSQKYLIETMGGGVALLDYNNDGLLDVFFVNSGRLDDPVKLPARFSRTEPAYWNRLYRQNPEGSFTDVSRVSGIAAVKGKALGVAFNDYDADGFPDVFVANDGMEEFLWHNNGNGTFTNRALEAGVALSDDGKAYSGMGVDFSDYDNDGRPDIVVTNLATEVYALYHNDGNGLFSYASLPTGLGAISSRSSGWGVGWEDFDNDGWKDLFVAQSHVLDTIERMDPGLRYKEPPLLARNTGRKLERVAIPGAVALAGRGAAFGDLDRNGFVDVVMTVLGGRPVV